ncbi:MAG: CAP domain-containing protein [Chloroflexota bacterium]
MHSIFYSKKAALIFPFSLSLLILLFYSISNPIYAQFSEVESSSEVRSFDVHTQSFRAQLEYEAYLPVLFQAESVGSNTDDNGNNGDEDNDDNESEDPFSTEFELEVIRLVNEERAEAGCNPVTAEPALRLAAYSHSKDMGDNLYFSHTGLNGSRFWDRAEDAGYTGFASGENIAAGYGSPASVMNAWMNSDGHRNNILNCRHTEIGVGHYVAGQGYNNYWTQVFGRR